jgi:murein DD-endopeptidase MepM/ murein hydrolase activator NlpD
MKWCWLLFGVILLGCSPNPGVVAVLPSSTVALLQVSIESPLPRENTPTPPAIPTETETPVGLPTLPPTSTNTETPTLTPIPWSYVFPLQPAGIADFSEGTAGHGYPATDIFAPEGTKFVAVTDGVVNFVSTEDRWDPVKDDPALRGGLSVAIIGDDGVRYYGSHLSVVAPGIRPGMRVTAGQVLGYVGHTGDARNTPSHLHFGISPPTTPDDWHSRRGVVDPYPFLVAWLDGHNVTPPLPTP